MIMGDWKNNVDKLITVGSIALNVANPQGYPPQSQYADYQSQQIQSSVSQTDTGRKNDGRSSK